MSVSYRDSTNNDTQNLIANRSNISSTIINNNLEQPTEKDSVDDGGFSKSVVNYSETSMNHMIEQGAQGNVGVSILHGANVFRSDEIKSSLYNKVFRFGMANPFTALGTAREYLFFTKPDLHIMYVDSPNNTKPSTSTMNPALASLPFWADLLYSRKNTTLKILQSSADTSTPFNYLLQNQCKSNLDIPGLSSEMIDTTVNNYGVGYSYRGSSEASDDGPEFSLEFKDNRFLDTFYFFKAYEEYETLKHHGVISPPRYYITNKIIHDCFSIYKFIVADDMETIIYWGKMYGVTPKSLPRDVFSNPNFDDGLSYSVDFKAAFYEDMRPEILSDFNYIGQSLYDSQPYEIHQYNDILGRPDTRPAEAAHVIVDSTSEYAKMSPTGFIYKLKWKGSSKG